MNFLYLLIYALAFLAAALISARTFRNRFLPIAKPIFCLSTALAVVIALMIWGNSDFLESQGAKITANTRDYVALSQGLAIIAFSLSFVMLPLWVWAILEFKFSAKVPFKRTWLLWIEPIICFFVLAVQIPSFNPSPEEAGRPISLLGDYQLFHRMYAGILATGVILWSGYTIFSKNCHSIRNLTLFCISLLVPIALFLAYRTELIPMPLGAPMFVFVLAWAAHQSSLLDAIPFAFTGIVEKLQAGLLIINAQNSLVYANKFASDALSIAELTERGFGDAHPIPEFINNSFNIHLRQIQKIEVNLPSLNGNLFVAAVLTPLVNETSGQFLGHMLLLQDVTRSKQIELELAEANKQLKQLHQDKLNFFAGVSHEFRTPLTLSLGNTSDLLSGHFGNLDEALAEPIESIQRNNERLLRLVAQLLDLSRLDAKAMKFSPQPVLLNDYLPMLVANFDSIAARQNSEVELSICADEAIICIDTDSLDKIVFNVLSNAFRSIESSGTVHISLSEDTETGWKLSVKDSGCGIPQDALPYIFEPFYTQRATHELCPEGTGIGLFLARELIRHHGGDIWADSIEGQGCEILMTFPKFNNGTASASDLKVSTNPTDSGKMVIQQHDLSHTNSSSPSMLDASTPGDFPRQSIASEKLILIVEDNTEMRRYIRRHLGADYRLIEAADGEEGLELAIQTVPDLIVTDLMMPKMNGLALCSALRGSIETSHIPVLMLTAKSAKTDKITALEHGVDDFLIKPFDADELHLRISNSINIREQLRIKFSQSASSNYLGKPGFGNEMDQKFMTSFKEFVLQNISQTDIRVAEIASHLNMSERSLHRKLKALIGQSTKQLLLSIRLDTAAGHLINSKSSITTIAYSCGFTDAAYFSRMFKARFLNTPMNYRKNSIQ